jgi:hypothetical protein
MSNRPSLTVRLDRLHADVHERVAPNVAALQQLGPQVRRLVERVEVLEAERERLELLVEQADAHTTIMYGELTKLRTELEEARRTWLR